MARGIYPFSLWAIYGIIHSSILIYTGSRLQSVQLKRAPSYEKISLYQSTVRQFCYNDYPVEVHLYLSESNVTPDRAIENPNLNRAQNL